MVKTNAQVAETVKPDNEQAKQYLIETEEIVCFDESGMRMQGKLNWVFSASTRQVTCYHIDLKPGR